MNLHGFTLNSIPKKDEHVPLRIIESTADGGTPENITTTIHPDNIDISIRATKLFGLQVAGVDIITTDITVPWHQNGAIINEINFSPLLGGSEISKKYVQSVMKEILQGDGKVPIYSLVGEEALSLAQKKQKRLLQQGISCFITSHKKTFNHLGFEMILPFNTLYQRTKSLLLNLQVEAIILIIQTDEVLTSGLAVDKITEITIVDKMIVSHEDRKSVV